MLKKKVILKSDDYPLKTRHYQGLPQELSSEKEHRTLLQKAKVLVVEETREGYFLFRYTESGEFAGDTWHQNLDEAFRQAEFEFGVKNDEWKDIPSEITD